MSLILNWVALVAMNAMPGSPFRADSSGLPDSQLAYFSREREGYL
jgi:hypothetical protein